MKKTTLALALALAACGMTNTSFAKVIPTADNPAGIKVGENNTTTVDVSVYTTGEIAWDAFDVEKGQTVNFVNGNNAVNIITSSKASTLKGTVGAYTGDGTGDANGTVSFYNAKGFAISNTFQFNGAQINFGLTKGTNIFEVTTGDNAYFKMDSGSFNISNKGVITGGMDLTTDSDNTIKISTAGNNVTVGDLTQTAGSVTITGKDIRTGNLSVTDSAMTFTASGSITTGTLTATKSTADTSFDFNATKNVTVKDVTAKAGATVTLDSADTGTAKKSSIGDVKIGNVDLNGAALTVTTAKNVKTGTVANDSGEITLNATSAINTGVVTGNAGFVTLNAAASVTTGNMILTNTKVDVDALKSVKIGDVTIDQNQLLINTTGSAASVVLGNIISTTGSATVKAYGKTISTGAIGLASGTIDLTSSSNATVGDVTFTGAGTITIDSAAAAKAGNLAMSAGTFNMYGTKTITVNDIDITGTSTVNLGDSNEDASVVVNDVVASNLTMNVYGASANIASVDLTGSTFNFKGETLKTGAFVEKSGANVILSDIVTSNIASLNLKGSSFTLTAAAKAKNVEFGTITTAESTSFNLTGNTAAVKTGLITANDAFVVNSNSITFAGITAQSNASVSVTTTGALDLGVVTLEKTGKMTYFTAGKGLKFASITDTATAGVVINVTGNISGGDITSDGSLSVTAAGNMAFDTVDLSANSTTFNATKGYINVVSLTNQKDSTLNMTATTNVTATTMNNAGTATITAPKVTLKNLTNTGTLTVNATDTFSSSKMIEQGSSVSTFNVGTFDVKDYSSETDGIIKVNGTKKFAIGASDAQGKFYVNENGTVSNLTVSIRSGAYFNDLKFASTYNVVKKQAAKNISGRNFKNSNYWTDKQ